MKAERPTGLLASPSQSLVVWWTAIRPRTLSIAATPVALGSALAWADGASPVWTVLLATLACALLIQVGTNLHNDVADFERGTDRPDRVGPLRVTAAGWVQPASVRMAARSSFGLALLLGFYLVVQGGWPILLMGMASLVAGWSYSGGARPISHTAWGEVFVLVFFGLVAVAGSHWLQQGDAWVDALLCGFIVGFPAAAVLLVNNFRDVENDLRSGRHTLAARLGDAGSQQAYAAMVLLPLVLAGVLAWHGRPGVLLAAMAAPYAWSLVSRLTRGAGGSALNALLGATARLGLVLGVLLSVGVFL
ncbi:MAG: 1,4-dihydroxy-2-naphthoate polyprenyltransferase [Rhodoferax sp.]|jgi:1,4-dihydroxy-2-naphthoate octaprenyltransferase|nr:1,4-dihydroxy-2-naphthoate polyprenyltransferase [Rhodoferax sp.]MBP9061190.1 1,4-dihydroxy-2-naphthoate polyprenyltransferase [Rhodoferax sp.]